MKSRPQTLVVISYYDRRPINPLNNLLESMREFDAGIEYSICVVVNRTTNKELKLSFNEKPLSILYRKNTGMNIGAWDHAWRSKPEFDSFLFLQDECYITKNNWLAEFKTKANERSVGLVGESMNKNWDHSWLELRKLQKDVKLREHEQNGVEINRVDLYQQFLADQNIPVGATGRHLRSLIWFATKETLESIDGFPIGKNYGECIAAEIGVSKKVEAAGLQIVQVRDNSFHFIRHIEWNQASTGSEFIHNSNSVSSQVQSKKEINDLPQSFIKKAWNNLVIMINNRVQNNIKQFIGRKDS